MNSDNRINHTNIIPIENNISENKWKANTIDTNTIKIRLLNNTKLSETDINKILDYLKNNISELTNEAEKKQIDIHLRPKDTGLPLPIQISKDKTVIIALKKWGKKLGSGNSREIKLAIILKENHPAVAHGTEEFMGLYQKNEADREIKILSKLATIQQQNPDFKGIMQFYLHIDYQSKLQAISINNSDPQNIQFNRRKRTQKENLSNSTVSEIEKRAILTKYYNDGNLENCIDNLTVKERIFVARKLFTGLKNLHELKIFHSDIKPDNIFIERDNNRKIIDVVIGDFGCACDLSDKMNLFYKNGEKSIRSPEIQDFEPGVPIDESILSSDIYALGLVMERLFTNIDKSLMLDNLVDNMISTISSERPSAKEALEVFEDNWQFIEININRPKNSQPKTSAYADYS